MLLSVRREDPKNLVDTWPNTAVIETISWKETLLSYLSLQAAITSSVGGDLQFFEERIALSFMMATYKTHSATASSFDHWQFRHSTPLVFFLMRLACSHSGDDPR